MFKKYYNLTKPKVVLLIVFTAIVGMFLSVPLTMALKIALDANPDTRPIAVMLGPELPDDMPKGRRRSPE